MVYNSYGSNMANEAHTTVTKSQSPPFHRKEPSRSNVKLLSDEHYDRRYEHKIACYDIRGVHRICGRHSEEHIENMHAQQRGVLRSESIRAALGIYPKLRGRSTVAAFCKALEIRVRLLPDTQIIILPY